MAATVGSVAAEEKVSHNGDGETKDHKHQNLMVMPTLIEAWTGRVDLC